MGKKAKASKSVTAEPRATSFHDFISLIKTSAPPPAVAKPKKLFAFPREEEEEDDFVSREKDELSMDDEDALSNGEDEEEEEGLSNEELGYEVSNGEDDDDAVEEEEASSSESDSSSGDEDVDEDKSSVPLVHPFVNAPVPSSPNSVKKLVLDAQGNEVEFTIKTCFQSILPPTSVKSRLALSWDKYLQAKQAEEADENSLTALLGPILGGYQDLLFQARELSNAVELRELYTKHICNHLFTRRDLVIRHEESAKKTKTPSTTRDQGFTRPRVLVLLPYRASAFRFLKLFLELFPEKTRIRNIERLIQDFGPPVEEEEAEWKSFTRACKASESYSETDYANGTHPCQTEAGQKASRPATWQAVFEENAEEDFRIGVAIRSPRSVKLYSGFYESDLIVASPLGLRLATKQAMETTGREEEGEELEEATNGDEHLSKRRKKSPRRPREEVEDTDFLSSIEILVVDEAEAFHMQNWQHMEDVLKGVNFRPKQLRQGIDFSRIYSHLLHAKSSALQLPRQTLLFSSFPDAQISSLLAVPTSPLGMASIRVKSYPCCTLPKVVLRYRRVDSMEARQALFASTLIPHLLDQTFTLLFVPSYLDYLQVRKSFRSAAKGKSEVLGKKDSWFEAVSEYSSASQVARARSLFFHGKTRVLIVTERLHYYFRYVLRGVQRIVFFAPPQHAEFFTELSVGMEEVVVFFTALEALELERLLGTTRAKKALGQSSPSETVIKS